MRGDKERINRISEQLDKGSLVFPESPVISRMETAGEDDAFRFASNHWKKLNRDGMSLHKKEEERWKWMIL